MSPLSPCHPSPCHPFPFVTPLSPCHPSPCHPTIPMSPYCLHVTHLRVTPLSPCHPCPHVTHLHVTPFHLSPHCPHVTHFMSPYCPYVTLLSPRHPSPCHPIAFVTPLSTCHPPHITPLSPCHPSPCHPRPLVTHLHVTPLSPCHPCPHVTHLHATPLSPCHPCPHVTNLHATLLSPRHPPHVTPLSPCHPRPLVTHPISPHCPHVTPLRVTPPSPCHPQHITDHLSALRAGWQLDLDTFSAPTPRGTVTFSNLVATLSPSAPRRLTLACHYDTKVLASPGAAAAFIGATDSAVPCAMLMEVAAALDGPLRNAKEGDAEVTLQLLFLDGEEAFEEWSATDSLYGARHLAARMAATRHGAHSTELSAMSLLVLLDLLGARNPAIHSHFPQTHHWFLRLVAIEKHLRRLGLLHASPHDQPFFSLSPAPGPVEDDHIPFLQRGVPVLHLIPLPFPWVWHTTEDNEDNLHPPTMEDLCKILTAFVAEFLQL
uniref:Glutaminyl-peptide cyclotransferase n=1 Tax=Chrysolophus pictus TaxID=9089 RepID=A0A8C3KXC1_CHRPC